MPIIARADDLTKCDEIGYTGGPLQATSTCLTAGGKLVIRLGDYAKCQRTSGEVVNESGDIVIEGAATVTLCGLPIARVKDTTLHGEHKGADPTVQERPNQFKRGAITLNGDFKDVIIGGPKFSIPENIFIDGSNEGKAKIIRNLYDLWRTNSGKEMFNRIEEAQESGNEIPIFIKEMPSHQTLLAHGMNPNNYERNSAEPVKKDDARAGTPTGTVIDHDPDQYFRDDGGTQVTPTIALGHELTHALANAEGRNQLREQIDLAAPVPSRPGSRANYHSETKASGNGSYSQETPNENSIRADLGLPPRIGDVTPVGAPGQRRFGDCE